MSTDQDDPSKPPTRSKRKPKGDYGVGYCRPPQKHQFKKGQPSRNPKGRPPRRAKTGNILDHVSDETVAYTKGGKRRKATLFELFLTRVMDDAVKGDRKAQAHFFAMRQRILRSKKHNPASGGAPLPVTFIVDGVRLARANDGPGSGPVKRNAHRSRGELFDRLAGRMIPVRDGDVRKRMSYEQAISRSVYAGAMKGDPKAWRLIDRFVDIDALPASSQLSDIIDENGVLKVSLNLGKLPSWEEDDEDLQLKDEPDVVDDDG
jgi:hypothetical protein